jgi:hypothetical protein
MRKFLSVYNALFTMEHMGNTDDRDSDHPETEGWYKPTDSTASSTTADIDEEPDYSSRPSHDSVEWTASEFIAHPKGPFWYVILAACVAVVTIVIYLITRDLTNVIVFAIVGIGLGVVAARPPRVLPYRVDRGGITIGRAFHPFNGFKSFALIDEGPFTSITLVPMKRFELPLNVYFSPEDEQKILDVLSNYLPLEQGALDSIDLIMRKIHF